MVCDGSESIGGGLVKRVQVNGSAIPNGSEVFAGMDQAPFDFVLSPALTKTGSGRMVRVIRTPEGKAQPHSFKRDEDRQSDLQVPAADAKAASMWDEARLVHPLRHARRHGEPLVNWLAGDEARYATGQLWVLDGGISAQVRQMRF